MAESNQGINGKWICFWHISNGEKSNNKSILTNSFAQYWGRYDEMQLVWSYRQYSFPANTDKEGGENWLKSYTVMVGTWVNKLPLSVHQVQKEKEVLEYLSLRIPFSECFWPSLNHSDVLDQLQARKVSTDCLYSHSAQNVILWDMLANAVIIE